MTSIRRNLSEAAANDAQAAHWMQRSAEAEAMEGRELGRQASRSVCLPKFGPLRPEDSLVEWNLPKRAPA